MNKFNSIPLLRALSLSHRHKFHLYTLFYYCLFFSILFSFISQFLFYLVVSSSTIFIHWVHLSYYDQPCPSHFDWTLYNIFFFFLLYKYTIKSNKNMLSIDAFDICCSLSVMSLHLISLWYQIGVNYLIIKRNLNIKRIPIFKKKILSLPFKICLLLLRVFDLPQILWLPRPVF